MLFPLGLSLDPPIPFLQNISPNGISKRPTFNADTPQEVEAGDSAQHQDHLHRDSDQSRFGRPRHGVPF